MIKSFFLSLLLSEYFINTEKQKKSVFHMLTKLLFNCNLLKYLFELKFSLLFYLSHTILRKEKLKRTIIDLIAFSY